MKRNQLVMLAALFAGLFTTSVSAQGLGVGACQSAKFLDVRGASSIDGALGPTDGQVTIAEVAVANPLGNLDTLVTAVLAADPGVLDALANPDLTLTVFAPDNDAFAAIPAPILTAYLSDPALVTEVLLYHVVGGTLDPRRFFVFPAETLLGQDLFFGRGFKGRSPTVNQSNINCTGVQTDNGLVWLIDSVLLPQY